MNEENKEYLRKLLNKLDELSGEVRDIIEDDWLQDEEEYAPIHEVISELQNEITEYQLINKYI
tara:strand:+ start:649 stop:837 length:189 start_codon:yes stop_codon:yes gene_type:complete